MVDIHGKDETWREAKAHGAVRMGDMLYNKVRRGNVMEKGDLWAVARVAGIMAAKQTSSLIPLCHHLALSHVAVDFSFDDKARTVHIQGSCRLWGRTGAEMEALTAVSVAALTLYDMCKALDKGIVITDIMLLEKKGGTSGTYRHDTFA